MVDAGVGLSPWDVLHQGLSEHTGVGIGTVSIALGLAIFLVWIPLKQRIGIGTPLNVLFIGLMINQFLARRRSSPTAGRATPCVSRVT